MAGHVSALRLARLALEEIAEENWAILNRL